MASFKARFETTCYSCKEPIHPGQMITWDRTVSKRGSIHESCHGAKIGMPTPVKEKVIVEVFDKRDLDIEDLVVNVHTALCISFGSDKSDPDCVRCQELRRMGEPFKDKLKQTPVYPKVSPDVPPHKQDCHCLRCKVVKPKEDGLTTLIADAVSEILGDRLKTDLLETLQDQVSELEAKLADVTPKITQVEVKRPNGTVVDAGVQHKLFPTYVRLTGYNLNMYLYGGPGSGKSEAPRQAAKALNRPFGLISMAPTTPDSKLFGYMDANGNYVSTLFRRIWEHGGFFCIDELDNASAMIVVTLNSALSNGICAFPDGMVPQHPDCVVTATGNTCGRGAHPAFPDRRPFDQSTASRLFYLQWEIDESFEMALCVAIDATQAACWVPWVQAVRRFCETSGIRIAVDPRSSFSLTTMGSDDSLSRELLVDGTIFRGIQDETKAKILASCPMPA